MFSKVNPETISWISSDCVEAGFPLLVAFTTDEDAKTVQFCFRTRDSSSTPKIDKKHYDVLLKILAKRTDLIGTYVDVVLSEKNKMTCDCVLFSVRKITEAEAKKIKTVKKKKAKKKVPPREKSTEPEAEISGNSFFLEGKEFVIGLTLADREEELKFVNLLFKELNGVEYDRFYVMSSDCKMTSGCRYPKVKSFVTTAGTKTIILTLCKYHPTKVQISEDMKKEIREGYKRKR